MVRVIMMTILMLSSSLVAAQQSQQRAVELITYNGQEVVVTARDDSEAKLLANASAKMIEFCVENGFKDGALNACILMKPHQK